FPLRTDEPAIDVRLEVWNRTLDPVAVVDLQGKRVDVPACGFAIADVFRVNAFTVSTAAGVYQQLGEGGVVTEPRERRLLVTSVLTERSRYFSASDPMPKLPTCVGHPSQAPTN